MQQEPTIDELFDRDPIEWTPRDLERIVDEFRNQAITFQKQEKEVEDGKRKSVRGKAATTKTKKEKVEVDKIDLSNFELKL